MDVLTTPSLIFQNRLGMMNADSLVPKKNIRMAGVCPIEVILQSEVATKKNRFVYVLYLQHKLLSRQSAKSIVGVLQAIIFKVSVNVFAKKYKDLEGVIYHDRKDQISTQWPTR
jgi:hypothetical protein